MRNSLQDQLFKAGLATKKQAVRAKKAKNKAEKQIRQGAAADSEAAKLVEKAKAEQLAKDKELNRQKNAKANSKAIEAQIVELVKLNRISERGDIEFSYNDNGQIKTLMLQNETRELLIKGVLNIVSVKAQHDIVPRAVANKIAERDENAIVLANDSSDSQELDDEYADYQVPDDLTW
jgi:uncharacterized protein YaiL (DUF2058 family)